MKIIKTLANSILLRPIFAYLIFSFCQNSIFKKLSFKIGLIIIGLTLSLAGSSQVLITIDSAYSSTPIDSAFGYPKGFNKQILFMAASNYLLDSLSVNNIYSSQLSRDSTQSYTFTNIQSPQSLQLVFSYQTYKINLITNNGGSIYPKDSVFLKGSSIRFYFVANSGYFIDSVFVDEIKSDSNHSFTFNNLDSSHSIRVVFKSNPIPVLVFTITASANSGGSISPSGSVSVDSGQNQIFIISPNNGYFIDSLIINGTKINSANMYTFENVIANQSIRVVFKQISNNYRLPANYIKVTAANTSCRNVNDGAISVKFDTALDYTIIIKAADYYVKMLINKSSLTHLSTPIKFTNLSVNIYSVIVYTANLDSNTGFKYTAIVNQPMSITAFTHVNSANKSLSVQAQGATTYIVKLNDKSFTFNDPNFELPLKTGLNKISIATEKDCQGSYFQEVFVSETITLYPNPSSDLLNVYLGGEDETVSLKIYDKNGKIWVDKTLAIPENRLLKINVLDYLDGIYFLDLYGTTLKGNFKFIKK